MTFRFAPGARSDLFDLVDWFEAQSPESGARVATALQNTLHRTLANPRMRGRVYRAPRGREVRVAKVERFHVLFTYEVTVNEIIILSVTHARSIRNPWRRRLP